MQNTIVYKPSLLTNSYLHYIGKVLLGSLLIAIGAQISIPFYPVPMTLQPEVIIIMSLFCSPSIAFGMTSAYVLEAAVGLPVLQGFAGGLPTLMGPRGGYIVGFIIMATLISYLSRRNSQMLTKIGACIIGHLVLFGCGVAWLSQFMGIEQALNFGLYPFLPKACLSVALAIIAYKTIRCWKEEGDKAHGH